MRTITGAVFALVIAVAFATAERTVNAMPVPCDFLTGGGFIMTTANNAHDLAKATFAIGGGCKQGTPTWGHLEYHDHGYDLNVHWLTITAYLAEGPGLGDTGTDPKTRQPTGTRLVCGTARTDRYGEVDFMVRAHDHGEPGTEDQFDIRLKRDGVLVYATDNEPGGAHQLNDGNGGGGNIQLHKPNPSTEGNLGGSCPARE